MAISYVGGYAINSSAGSISSISLTSLAGGSGSAPIENDLVIVAVNNNKALNTSSYPVIDTSGYNTIAQIFSDDSNEVQAIVSYKLMGSTPDTAISFSNIDNGRGCVAAVYVWRGINLSSPLDVTSVSTTAIDSAVPDPASITPTTAGSVVIAIGMSAYGNSSFEITAVSSGYSNSLITSGNAGGTTARASIGLGSKAWTSGAENPGVYTTAGTATTASWGALTLALRVQPLILTAAVGSFALTGQNSILKKGFKVLASAGSYILSGVDALFNLGGWIQTDKNSSTWTDPSKSSSTWSEGAQTDSNWQERDVSF